jgi:hypothetical protein
MKIRGTKIGEILSISEGRNEENEEEEKGDEKRE